MINNSFVIAIVVLLQPQLYKHNQGHTEITGQYLNFNKVTSKIVKLNFISACLGTL